MQFRCRDTWGHGLTVHTVQTSPTSPELDPLCWEAEPGMPNKKALDEGRSCNWVNLSMAETWCFRTIACLYYQNAVELQELYINLYLDLFVTPSISVSSKSQLTLSPVSPVIKVPQLQHHILRGCCCWNWWHLTNLLTQQYSRPWHPDSACLDSGHGPAADCQLWTCEP